MGTRNWWKGGLALALSIGFAAMASAQAPAGYVLAGEGRVMARKGDNVIVDVKQGKELGIRKFKITSDTDLIFYKGGKQIDVFGLRQGDNVTLYRKSTSTQSSVVISMEEAQREAAAPEPAPAPKPAAAAPRPAPVAAAPAPAPAPEAKPAELPATGSPLPLVFALGVAFLSVGAGLRLARRS